MVPHLHELALWAATEAEAAEGVVPPWVKLLLTIAVFLVPYGLGVLIARMLKVKEYAFRISVVLFAMTLGLMPFFYQAILAQMERADYANRVEEWQTARKESPLQSADIDEFKKDYPTLNINRPKADAPPPEISPADDSE